ncbi:MAG: extracellular solute-binding protein [Phycisphaeraceae bacterium]
MRRMRDLITPRLGYLAMVLGVIVLLSQWGRVVDHANHHFGDAASDRPKQITQWSWSGSPQHELGLARDFMAQHPDVSVDIHFAESGTVQNVLYVSFASGNPPDLIGVSQGDLRQMVAAGMIRPLDDLLQQQLEADPDFIDQTVDGPDGLLRFQVNPDDEYLRDPTTHPLEAARLLAMHGQVVGFTDTRSFYTLTYNKRLFREAAQWLTTAGRADDARLLVDEQGEARPPATWTTLRQTARLISEYGQARAAEGRSPVYGIVVQGQRPRDIMRGLEPLAATAGSRGFNFAGRDWLGEHGLSHDGPAGYYEYDHPALIAAFKLLMLMRQDDAILPGTSSRHFEESREAVGLGQAAMIIDGWWSALIAGERVPWATEDIGSAPVPVPDEQIEAELGMQLGRGAGFRQVSTTTSAIGSLSQHPWATWQWMNFNRSDAAQQRSAQRGGLPGTNSAVARLDDPDWFPYQWQGEAWRVYEASEVWPEPPTYGHVRGVATAEEVFQDALLRGDASDLDQLGEQVRSELAAFSDAVNRQVAEQVARGEIDPQAWTFSDWDPASPQQSFREQRRRSLEESVDLGTLRAKLPAELRDFDADDLRQGRLMGEQDRWHVLAIPGLMLLAVGAFVASVLVRHRRRPLAGLREMGDEARRNRHAYVFIFPAMVMLFAFIIYPAFYQFYLALHQGAGIGPMRYVGWNNFAALAADANFWGIVLPNTFIYMVGVTVAQIVAGLLLASVLNLPLRGGGLFRLLFFVPLVVSLAAVSVVFIGLLGGADSAVNNVLAMTGLADLPYWLGLVARPGDRLDWLGNPGTDLWMVMLVGVWHGLPYTIILILAGLQSISAELYEAARVDGANAWHRFRHVTLPQLAPILVIIVFNALVSAARVFGPVYVLTEGGSRHSSEVASTYIFKWGFTREEHRLPDVGYASAVGVVYGLLLAALLVVNVWFIFSRVRRNIAGGGEQAAEQEGSRTNG